MSSMFSRVKIGARTPERHRSNGEMYDALLREDDKKVIELCQEAPGNALQILTIHNDTVLHIATYSKQGDLVHKLLEELPDHHVEKMTRQNDLGNTVLHEAATTNQALPIARAVLRKAPGLLGMRNHLGETALFRAASYGKTEMFDFFATRMEGYTHAGRQIFLQRNDKTTVLHVSILSQHFDLALKIAKRYPHLIDKPDVDGMTGLQLLSCNPSAFKRSEDAFLKRLINSIDFCSSSAKREAKREARKKEKQRYTSVLDLAKFLIEKDTSWEATYPGIDQSRPKLHRYGVTSIASSNEKGGGEVLPVGSLGQGVWERDPPLFLATKSGCVEIVEEILKLYPQAVEYIDDEGRNILHVAIKYRQKKIFRLVTKLEVPKKRLVQKVDINGNSLLHMVGLKRKDYVHEKMLGPAFELQSELLWFQRVKKVTVPHFINHRNHEKQTADGLFATTNAELREKAKEWLKRTAEGCSIVAVLIATVAFAAAYTVPGGSNPNGRPVLLHRPFFVVFTVTDVLSLSFALTSVVTFLSIASSPFRLEDFKRSLPNKLVLGFTFLFLSVAVMMISFAATIILMVHNKENWTKIILYATSFLPVGIFALSYFPLYVTLSKSYKYFIRKARKAIPWSDSVPSSTNLFNCSARSATRQTTRSPV